MAKTETKWTPGQWRVGMDQFVVDANEDVVCDVSRPEDSSLIAAAPDLADAGARALDWLREAYGHANAPYNESAHRCINDLAAALAKAEGK